MIIFRNPGVIDLAAAVTLGVTVKKPGSFGRFGTGVKFAIATVLRGGGSVTLYAGGVKHVFGTKPKKIQGAEFSLVTLGRKELGFTTSMGRDWEPWMVLREFGCNAKDEGGEFFRDEATEGHVLDDNTVFAVEWDLLDQEYERRDELFLTGEPVEETLNLRILPGPASHAFYRGVRALKWDKPTLYSYDVLLEQQLTEDRTMTSAWSVNRLITSLLLRSDNKALLINTLSADKEKVHEGSLDFEQGTHGILPSKAFLDAAIEIRQSSRTLNASAKKILQKHMRSSQASSGGGGYSIRENAFIYAIGQLEKVGIKFSEEQAFINIDEMPDGANSIVEDGRIYVRNSFINSASAREVALELVARWVDLQNCWDMDGLTKIVAPMLVDLCPDLKRHEKMVAEDLSDVSDEAVTEEEEA